MLGLGPSARPTVTTRPATSSAAEIPARNFLQKRVQSHSPSPHEAVYLPHDNFDHRHLDLLIRIRATSAIEAAGDHPRAVREYQQILQDHPGQPGLWFALARAWLAQGVTTEAIPCLEKALDLRPSFAPYLRHLGEAYCRVGRLEEAVQVLTRAVRIDPRHSEVLLYLAVASFQRGDLSKGKAYLAKSVATALHRLMTRVATKTEASLLSLAARTAELRIGGNGPYRCRVARRLGEWNLKRCRFAAAELCYRKALDDAPDDARAQCGLGRSLLEQGLTLEALLHLRTAVATQPLDAEGWTALGRAYRRRDEAALAVECLHKALELDPESPRVSHILGWSQLRLENPVAALQHFSRCLELDPGCADAAFGMAQGQQNLGNMDESEDWLRRTLEIEPNHAGSLLALVTNNKRRRNSETLAAAKRVLADNRRATDQRVHAHFTIAVIEDHLGHYERAFENYEAANSLKDVTFDLDALLSRAQGITSIFTSEFFTQRRHYGVTDERPIFIVGMPRSGSTLVEQILASHPDVTGGGELPHLPKHLRAFQTRCPPEASDPGYLALLDENQAERFAQNYLADLETTAGDSARITDKRLFNYWYLGVIALALPKAKIIHIKRNALDCCASIYLRDFAGVHGYAYNQENLGRYYRIYAGVMEHWRRVLPIPILELRYEELIAQPESMMRRMIAFCGLEWDETCLDFHKTQRPVSTSSHAQVRQPIYNTAIGKWRRYEKQFGALKAALSGQASEPAIGDAPKTEA